MRQIQLQSRQRSLSNYSSLHTPNFKRRNTLSKNNQVFLNRILKKQQKQQSELDQPMIIRKNSIKQQQRQKNSQKSYKLNRPQRKSILQQLSPNIDLNPIFKNNQPNYLYLKQLQQQQFKPLIIISILLPFQKMKKFIKVIQISNQYRFSVHNCLFTKFYKLNNNNSNSKQQVNYCFWTLQISQQDLIKKNLHRQQFNIRKSMLTSKSLKQAKSHHHYKQPNQLNLLKLLIDFPQIIISTKKFIQLNSGIFSQSDQSIKSDIQIQTNSHNINKYITNQLNIQKTLLYFQFENQINHNNNNKNNKIFQSPKNNIDIEEKKFKKKENDKNDDEVIRLQVEEEYYDDMKKQRNKQGKSKRINFKQDNIKEEQNNLEQFQDMLYNNSIFKFVQKLPQNLLINDLINSSQLKQSTNTNRLRKNSYQGTNINSQIPHKFNILLLDHIKLSLKKNPYYSNFSSTWLFTHLLTQYYRYIHNLSKQLDQPIQSSKLISYIQLLKISLKRFKQQIQQMYKDKIQKEYIEIIDQAQLRNILRNIRKDLIVFLKKNLNSIVFIQNSNIQHQIKNYNKMLNHEMLIDQEYLAEYEYEIMLFFDNIQKNIYYDNNTKAITKNQQTLQTLYKQIIQPRFKPKRVLRKAFSQSSNSIQQRRLNPSYNQQSYLPQSSINNPVSLSTTLQQDFSSFMQSYSIKGIKVSSQLKTFNIFMQRKKNQYLKNIQQIIKLNEQKYNVKQQEEKQNKYQMIKLLENQIIKLEEKRKQIKIKNQLLKKKTEKIQQTINVNQEQYFKNKKYSNQHSIFQINNQQQSQQQNQYKRKPNKLKNSSSFSKKISQLSRKNKSKKQINSQKSQNIKGQKKIKKYQQNQQLELDQQKIAKYRCIDKCCQIM